MAFNPRSDADLWRYPAHALRAELTFAEDCDQRAFLRAIFAQPGYGPLREVISDGQQLATAYNVWILILPIGKARPASKWRVDLCRAGELGTPPARGDLDVSRAWRPLAHLVDNTRGVTLRYLP